MLHLHQAAPVTQRDMELKTFLCDRYWLPAAEYPMCGDVFRALGISGDDCPEFMNALAEQFDLDLFDFIWPKFHLGEDEAMDVRAALRPLRRFVGIRTQPLDRDLIPISIDHLLQVIDRGAWFDPQTSAESDDVGVAQSLTRISARLRAGGVPRKLRR